LYKSHFYFAVKKSMTLKEEKMMKRILTIVFVATIFFVSPVHANVISTSDAWQYNNISSISTSTIHGQSNVSNMFGASLGSADIGSTVFNDYSAQGYWHTVQWTLNSAIILGSFNLVAAHDGTNYNPNDGYTKGYRDQNYRGFSAFTLEYLDAANNWQTLYSLSNIGTTAVLGDGSTHPVYGGGVNYPSPWVYELYADVAPTSARTWQISFQQYGPANGHASGPRILELDGFVYTNSVPEPATLILLGLGLFGLAGAKRKFQK
jgi:hypothetical protein